MEIKEGLATLDQIVYGRLHFLKREQAAIVHHSQLGHKEEQERFFRAQHRAVKQVSDFYDQAFQRVGIDTASIFAVHAMLLEDIDLVDSVLELIQREDATAEYAVRCVGENFADTFASLDNPYMQARAADVKDIYRRLIRLLQHGAPEDPLRDGPAILVADEFMPSEVMDANRARLLGVVSRKGSLDSHTAMLLQAYHIPAIAHVDLEDRWDGHLALIDGIGQRLYLEPERSVLETLRQQYETSGRVKEPAYT